ncbi:HD domain-containing protein [Solibacillus isronensis]|uniref:HD domain-containing protein n=1 Tax=Solibacillus isronensis TaxID=412383 RepID=UPI00203D31BB|nr:ATP-binding protein [Solibacillus isronensis]MCM3722957.1 ATP-binding protein [Solibacillus isronensis]
MVRSSTIINSQLWKKSLGDSSEWGFDNERQRLINAFDSFRENANVLANEIAIDLPDFTVHDETHLDALWEMGSQIAGDGITLNPIEAFVFGGAVLLHDLGMASVAYINGVDDLKKGEEWEDALEYAFRQSYGRPSTIEDNKFEDNKILKIATESRLRLLHAHQAERLCFLEWKSSEGITYKLLNDTQLLDHLGEVIGKIAASHWWPIEKVEAELKRNLGSPTPYPVSWSVDCLKIASLLRCADAAHIDNRRAPSLLKVLRRPTGLSESHWTFQNKLSRPVLENDLLVYNSIRSFKEDDIESWWIAYDTIRMIDNEIKYVNNTLKNNGREPFKVYGVKGANNVNILSEHIHTQGWEPVNLDVKISNVSHIVKHLGGAELYGDFKYIPLREAIQNAVDAIEAKRKLYGWDENFGKIVVSYGEDEYGRWIEISDNGIGMSKRVVTEKLLDFGSSYWQSSLMMDEHIGLLARGFKSIGKYGLGFFSLFMLGDVSVTTRSVHAGPEETFALSVNKNLNHKPILKKVNRTQQIPDSGTKVKIYLDEEVSIEEIAKSLSLRHLREFPDIKDTYGQLSYILKLMAPTLSVDLYLKMETEEKIIGANDWKSIDNKELISRLIGYEFEALSTEYKESIEKFQHLLTPIYNQRGEMVARLGIMPISKRNVHLSGMITCGGLISEFTNRTIVGVLTGEAITANRYFCKPYITVSDLSTWAQEQCSEIEKLKLDFILQCSAANIINLCNAHTQNLLICDTNEGYKSFNDLVSMDLSKEIVLTERNVMDKIEKINENVIVIGGLGGSFFEVTSLNYINYWPLENEEDYSFRGNKLVTKAIAENWGVDVNSITEVSIIKYKHDEGVNKAIGVNKYGEEIMKKVTLLKMPTLGSVKQ